MEEISGKDTLMEKSSPRALGERPRTGFTPYLAGEKPPTGTRRAARTRGSTSILKESADE